MKTIAALVGLITVGVIAIGFLVRAWSRRMQLAAALASWGLDADTKPETVSDSGRTAAAAETDPPRAVRYPPLMPPIPDDRRRVTFVKGDATAFGEPVENPDEEETDSDDRLPPV